MGFSLDIGNVCFLKLSSMYTSVPYIILYHLGRFHRHHLMNTQNLTKLLNTYSQLSPILEDPLLFFWSLQVLGIDVVYMHNAGETFVHIK